MFGFVCKHGSTVIRFVLWFLSTNALEIHLDACQAFLLIILNDSEEKSSGGWDGDHSACAYLSEETVHLCYK